MPLSNPLSGNDVRQRAAPSVIVIFGASGDLARRKLIPALFKLSCEGLIPEETLILGYARTVYSDEEFREKVRQGIRDYTHLDFPEEAWDSFASHIFFQSGSYDGQEDFQALRDRIYQLEEGAGLPGNRLFYLSTPPEVFEPVTSLLGEMALTQNHESGWRRLVVEKPFGHDLASARRLNQHLLNILEEKQIYRIDHYLGKETVQNILFLRFANGIFEPIWNRNYVDHVQITVAESLGVEGRGGYYDQSGAMRDIVQNHGLQIVALTAMEPPVSLAGEAIRDQKVNVLRSIRPLTLEEVPRFTARGQYVAGDVEGRRIPGYLDEKGVRPHSTTETYVAWKLEIDNWRWKDVPFYIRSGKGLAHKRTEVTIVFRHAPHLLFEGAEQAGQIHSNILRLRLQPNEGIDLQFGAKKPGPAMHIAPVDMNFNYLETFGDEPTDAYERLLLDVMLGDGTLFTRRDEVEEAWDRVNRVQDGWRKEDEESDIFGLPMYRPGSWGPHTADELLARDGRRWRNLPIDPV